MKVRFLGAVGTVTGSCSWMQDEARGWNFLVDCGLQQEDTASAMGAPNGWPFDPAALQFVALTHAHLDHSGLLPALCRDGFRGPVYCTSETAALAQLALSDAARRSGAGITQADVDRIQWRRFREDLPFGQPRPVAQDLFLRTYRAGHIPGAVSIEVLWGAPGPEQRNIVFSGDIGPGCEDHEVAPMLRFPWNPRRACFAVLESTYGGTVRSPESRSPGQRLSGLNDLVASVVESGGTLLLPAFAIGRAQDLLFDLHAVVAADPERFQRLEIVLDAPLARRVNAVVATAMQRTDVTRNKVRPLWLGKQVFRQLGLDDTEPDDIQAALNIILMTFVSAAGDAALRVSRGNALARQWRPLTRARGQAGMARSSQPDQPTVIVCGSADGCGGAAAAWLPVLLRDPRNIIATTGYTAPHSVMGQTARLAELPFKERRRHPGSIAWPDGRSFPIRDVAATITSLKGYSAHADQTDLLEWVFLRRQDGDGVVAPTLFIQHGEDRAREALRDAVLKQAAVRGERVCVHLPQPADAWHWLDMERTEVANPPSHVEKVLSTAPNSVELTA